MPTSIFASSANITVHREPAVANGQTTFTLPSTPVDATTLEMKINGVVHSSVQSPGVLTIATNVVTWTNALFTISSDDEIWFTYQ